MLYMNIHVYVLRQELLQCISNPGTWFFLKEKCLWDIVNTINVL